MQLNEFFHDDDAVSPVIGVILMVAITVILAAVIATFVLGLGDSISGTAPQASFSFEWDGSPGSPGPLTIKKTGGDTVEAGNLFVRGSYGGGNGAMDVAWTDGPYAENSDVSAGNRLTISGAGGDAGTNDVASDGEADVVWERTQGDTSATLGSWEGPDA